MAEESYRIERYRRTRFFALYDHDELVAVTAYKKGAAAVRERLEAKDRMIEELKARFSAAVAADLSPPGSLSSDALPAPERNGGPMPYSGHSTPMKPSNIFATATTTGKALQVGCFAAGEKLRAVAVRGEADDWAAYADKETCDEGRIATHGLKLEQATAKRLFPDIGLKYRP